MYLYRWAQQKKGHSNFSGEPFSSCLENRLIRFSLIWLATVAAYRLRIVRTINPKVPKHKLLCIHRKFDEAFNHVRSSLPEPTEANFRCMVAHLDSAAPGSHAPSPKRHCAQNTASSQPLTMLQARNILVCGCSPVPSASQGKTH